MPTAAIDHRCVGVTGPAYTADQCRVCWLGRYGADATARRARPGPRAAEPDRLSLPCVHLGPETGERRACRTCQTDPPTTAAVHRCAAHGECTVERPAVRTAGCCKHCREYRTPRTAEPDPEPRRHLLYHLLPVAGNGVWRRGVDHLRLRWGLFTGRKVVAVMTGRAGRHRLDPPADVRAHLPADAEVIEVANDPGLREVASWAPLWEALFASAADADHVLYCHAKGATRQVDPGNSCQWWASLLYSLALDHWPLVAGLLARHPIAGPFKKVGHGFVGSRSAWHYSGTFYWQRAGEARRRDWRGVDRAWWGTESWPGCVYAADEAGCVFLPGTVPHLNLYSPPFWAGTLRPEYERWLRANPPAWPWPASAAPVR